MATAGRTKKDIAADMVRSMPDVPTRTIAQSLHRKHPTVFPSIENARESVRQVRGNHGVSSRKNANHRDVKRPNQSAGYVAKMPPSEMESWEPFVLDGVSRVLSISDLHIPYHDPDAINLAIKTGQKNKADCILINGDLIDFYQLSRFIRDPTRRTAIDELEMSCELLLYVRGKFPKSRIVYKAGNHDERWSHYLWSASPILFPGMPQMQLESVLAHEIGRKLSGDDGPFFNKLSEYGIEYVQDQRPIMAGALPILHGHELPKGMTSPVNPARGAYMRTAHTVLVGHSHRSSQHVEPDMFGSEVACWSQGCLCGMRPEYARINRWNQGFAFVEIHDNKEFELTNYRIADGKVRTS